MTILTDSDALLPYAMVNYTDIPGVHAAEWPDNDEQENWDERDAMVEEMYYEKYSGRLVVTIRANDCLYSFGIPITAQTEWNEFVASLPTWDIPE